MSESQVPQPHVPVPYEDQGGDPACWLSHVCPECGALVEGSTAVPCWRCGAVREPDE
jgi:hypothetical protein